MAGDKLSAQTIPASRRGTDSRILRIGYTLVTANLWLRTVVLAAISIVLILLAFHWHVTTRPTIPSFLAAQLGTGLLVAAVGAALVQAVIMSAPQKMQELVDELRARSPEASFGDRLAELTAELRAHSLSTGQGISEAGIVNVYTDRESAQERIQWLVSHATRRVWIQGVSLSHHLDPPLYAALLHLMETPGIDTRVLVLAPDSDQAVRKSYRDYLLGRNGGTSMGYGAYARDRRLYQASSLYDKLRRSSKDFNDLSSGSAGQFQVRQYECAPTSYILIADDHALIEQFHYGKPVDATDSVHDQVQLAHEMPLVEYVRPDSALFPPKPGINPFAVIEDHFTQVFQHFGSPISRSL